MEHEKALGEAGALKREGKTEAARDLLGRLLAELPDDPEATYYFGVCSHELGDEEAAIRSLSRVATRPNSYQGKANELLDRINAKNGAAPSAQDADKRNDRGGHRAVVGRVLSRNTSMDLATQAQLLHIQIAPDGREDEVVSVEVRGYDMTNAGNLQVQQLVRCEGSMIDGVLHTRRIAILHPGSRLEQSAVTASFGGISTFRRRLLLGLTLFAAFIAATVLAVAFLIPTSSDDSNQRHQALRACESAGFSKAQCAKHVGP
jgi:hypothetical protein